MNDRGDLRRFMSLAASDLPTFGKPSVPADNYRPVITKVRDNLRTSDTKRYYEIVPRGMRENALAYVDRREHEWNGLDARGMPAYLIARTTSSRSIMTNFAATWKSPSRWAGRPGCSFCSTSDCRCQRGRRVVP